VEFGLRRRGSPHDVASVLRNFRVKQDQMIHEA
jgi:hypothetical protein